MDMFKSIRSQYGDISVCIYSAGVAHVASLLEGKTEDWKDMFEVRQQYLALPRAECLHQSLHNS